MILLTILAAGIAMLPSSHPADSAPFILIPLALGFLATMGMKGGLRYLARDTPKLIQEINQALDGTSAPPGSAT